MQQNRAFLHNWKQSYFCRPSTHPLSCRGKICAIFILQGFLSYSCRSAMFYIIWYCCSCRAGIRIWKPVLSHKSTTFSSEKSTLPPWGAGGTPVHCTCWLTDLVCWWGREGGFSIMFHPGRSKQNAFTAQWTSPLVWMQELVSLSWENQCDQFKTLNEDVSN